MLPVACDLLMAVCNEGGLRSYEVEQVSSPSRIGYTAPTELEAKFWTVDYKDGAPTALGKMVVAFVIGPQSSGYGFGMAKTGVSGGGGICPKRESLKKEQVLNRTPLGRLNLLGHHHQIRRHNGG